MDVEVHYTHRQMPVIYTVASVLMLNVTVGLVGTSAT
jgi:hypothetical protein